MPNSPTSSQPGSRSPARYQIPTHLDVPDKFVLPLFGFTISVTMRQGLILLLGWSTAFNLWNRLEFLGVLGIVGDVARVLFPGLLALVTFVFATLQVAGRHPEAWMIAIIQYLVRPKVYIWSTVNTVTPERMASPKDQPKGVSFQQQEGV